MILTLGGYESRRLHVQRHRPEAYCKALRGTAERHVGIRRKAGHIPASGYIRRPYGLSAGGKPYREGGRDKDAAL